MRSQFVNLIYIDGKNVTDKFLFREGEGICVNAAECADGSGRSVGTCANCNGCATCCKVQKF
jgi:hypothetical protein